MSLPRAPHRLPDDMAAAIGHAVSGFGFLEEALKRALYSLTRKELGEDAPEAKVQAWVNRIEEIADDSLGTLIQAFGAAMRKSGPSEKALLADMEALRLQRNLLCHASWRTIPESSKWHPTFINTRGESYPEDLDANDINAIHDKTLAIAAQVVAIMRQTGIVGELTTDGEEGHDHD